VALRVLQVIEREHLADNARTEGEFFKTELQKLAQRYPAVIKSVRGVGLMLGIELATGLPAFAGSDQAASVQFVNQLHAAGLLAILAGSQVVRFLPPLNLKRNEIAEGLKILETIVAQASP
jgi:4-aminobutyrate aminotransferase-like enzyme